MKNGLGLLALGAATGFLIVKTLQGREVSRVTNKAVLIIMPMGRA